MVGAGAFEGVRLPAIDFPITRNSPSIANISNRAFIISFSVHAKVFMGIP
jgi:hypothetical protein